MNARNESESSRRQEETERLYQRLDPRNELYTAADYRLFEEQVYGKYIKEKNGNNKNRVV